MLDNRTVDLRFDQLEDVRAKNGKFVQIPKNNKHNFFCMFMFEFTFKSF